MTAESVPWQLRVLDLDLGAVNASIATNAGPRVLTYGRPWGSQFFADAGSATIDHPDSEPFLLLGGHRLWRSPEVPSITYTPDHTDVKVTRLEAGADVEGPADQDGIVKRIEVRQAGELTIVTHTLTNTGSAPVETAPWAITQMADGGTAVLPIADETADPQGLQANRRLVLWPYTDLGQPGIHIDSRYIKIDSRLMGPRTKVGHANRRGWIAYVIGGEVFVKWAALHDDGATYPDLGASMQCYREGRLLELETVGPLVELAPGSETTHRETWTIINTEDADLDDVLDRLPRQPEGVVS